MTTGRALAELDDWSGYLGGQQQPARAAGEPRARRRRRARSPTARAPPALIATGDEFSVVCGLVASGRLFGEGATTPRPRCSASTRRMRRWRVREGVAMGGAARRRRRPRAGLRPRWRAGRRSPIPLVEAGRRAPAVCEPRAAQGPGVRPPRARPAHGDHGRADRRGPPGERRQAAVRTLRQALGYGWSVVVAALPDEGLPAFERLARSPDPDVAWIVRENLKKARLKRVR